jgi:GcrA cell cycle regulator
MRPATGAGFEMSDKRRRKITDAQLATFKVMWAEGKSYREISDAIGISVSALGSSRERWGMPPRIRTTSEANIAAAELTEARKLARTGKTLDTLASLIGIEFPAVMPAPTDAKCVSRKFLPEHKCGWPIGEPGTKEFRLCGDHCTTPGPYCDDHRTVAHLTPEEAAEQWRLALTSNRRFSWT